MNEAANNPIIERVFEVARSGGYKEYSEYYHVHFMNPLFWQALGKALGWDKIKYEKSDFRPYWLDKALHYHYLVLTGSSTDKFWQDLLTQ